jgi:hypothetical protein
MNRPRLILRIVFLVLTVSVLGFLGNKNEKDIKRIAEFKFAQLERLRSDSLNSEARFEAFVKETKEFSGQIIEESSLVKDGLLYLTVILVAFLGTEMFFYLKSGRPKDVS